MNNETLCTCVEYHQFYGQKCNPIFTFVYFKARDPFTVKILFASGGHVEKTLPDIDSSIQWAVFHLLKVWKEWEQVSIYDKDQNLVIQYQDLSSAVRDVWKTLTDVPFTEDEKLDDDWFIFEKGTDKYEIWHWFDAVYPDGVKYLLDHQS